MENSPGNVWAVGRNYEAHARELGNQFPSNAGEPMIFLKAGSGVVANRDSLQPSPFALPAFSQNVHFETELVFRFGPDFQFRDFTIGIDLTARDLQDRAKSQGHPWTLAKSFRDSCLLGRFHPLPADPQALRFQLKVNGEIRQTGDARNMIHPIEKVRVFLLERFPVSPGDLVMTGTPEGVGRVDGGDLLEAEVPNVVTATWRALPSARSGASVSSV